MRWTIQKWIEYLRHPAAIVTIRIRGREVSVFSGEGTERWLS